MTHDPYTFHLFEPLLFSAESLRAAFAAGLDQVRNHPQTLADRALAAQCTREAAEDAARIGKLHERVLWLFGEFGTMAISRLMNVSGWDDGIIEWHVRECVKELVEAGELDTLHHGNGKTSYRLSGWRDMDARR